MRHEAIVIGVSSGGMNALTNIFSRLPGDFSIPVMIVQHLSPRSDKEWIKLLDAKSKLRIKEADEKEKIENGKVYIAPPNYHLLVEKNKTFSLSIDERVNFARPSVDVLFESAADAYGNTLIGVVLTGANSDGAKGMRQIKRRGGLTIVEDPETAESPAMPTAVLTEMQVDHILPLHGIIDLLIELAKK
jgi:two-component system chemotaxis response regulator CheB